MPTISKNNSQQKNIVYNNIIKIWLFGRYWQEIHIQLFHRD